MPNKTCKKCIYLFRAENCRDTFICTNKHNEPGRLFILKEDQTCRNYSTACVPHRPKIRQPADPNTRFIPLTQGRFAIVDAADYDWLNQYKWCTATNGYRSRFSARANVKGRGMYMHRLIMKPPPGMVVDHIDGNGLNNKRENLRICTQKQNSYNRKGQSKTSKYKGIYLVKNKWRARIHYSEKTICIGRFDNQIDAAKAYDKKAKDLFGQFAYLNFPDDK